MHKLEKCKNVHEWGNILLCIEINHKENLNNVSLFIKDNIIATSVVSNLDTNFRLILGQLHCSIIYKVHF